MKPLILHTAVILFLWSYTIAYATDNILGSGETPESAGLKNSFSNTSKYQTSVAYWNDNILSPERINIKYLNGKDDYVTASFLLQIAFENHDNWWFLDFYHNILTNKHGKYRTDLLTCRLSIEKLISTGSVRFGAGIIANGNFGGKTIQNGYHKLVNINQVELPYVEKEETGFIALLRYEPVLWRSEHIRFKGYAANSYRSAAGPSKLSTGLILNVTKRPIRKTYVLYLQTGTGYINYYHSGKYISPLFDNGLIWGVLLSGGNTGKYCVAVWITGNQYGLEQPHYGISFSFGWNGSRMFDLSDITFP